MAAELFDAALAAGHEGVMVKSLHAPYSAGRRGRAWQKVKPVHTLDLVVLAAEWGHGRRRGWLDRSAPRRATPMGGPPVMVGKTFKGLTDQLLTWQTQALQDIAQQDIAQRTDRHVVHVRPELVVEIELDGCRSHRGTRAEWRCGSPECCGTGRTKTRATPTPSTPCAPCWPFS